MQLLLLASLIAAAASTPVPNRSKLFESFIARYNKVYPTELEKNQRFQIFSDNIDDIYASNSKNHSYTLGITKHTDLTFEEWRLSHLSGFKPVPSSEQKERLIFRASKGFVEPDSVDWVAKGGVTSVKNQGTCGSCWTFSTVGALEGAMAISGRTVVNLSMQHILACDPGGNGCGGGMMDQAFDWVRENGITSLEGEPYLCEDGSAIECKAMSTMACPACPRMTGETCNFGACANVAGAVCDKAGIACECPSDQCFVAGKCTEKQKQPHLVLNVGDVVRRTDVKQSENALEAAVAQQPVSVAIEADKAVFQHYTSGILTSEACGSDLDHGVLAVGYGTDNGQKYWKVKNSWGESFGEEGYIRIAKGDTGGECGIRKMASFPTLKASISSIVV